MSDERVKNAGVAATLQEQGDALDVPRPVRHWAYFKTPADRDRFIASLGMRFESVETHENPESPAAPCEVTVFHVGLPDAESMTAVTTMLERLATASGGEYDGWETQVVA